MHLLMFDIDGTLVNSSEFDEACYLKAANEVLGINISSNWEEYTHTTDAGILKDAIIKYHIPGDAKHITEDFRRVFINLISGYIEDNPGDVHEISGASQFIRYLCAFDNIKVAIATGGWEETAKLKLTAAGINISGCVFASSSDHHRRTDIMKIAESRATKGISFVSKTYFGDAAWDKQASEVLNYRFVAVGNRIEHKFHVNDFRQKEKILKLLDV